MKSRFLVVFLCIIAIFAQFIVPLTASAGMAEDYTAKLDASKWQSLVWVKINSVWNNSNFSQAYKEQNGYYGKNCKIFVQKVMSDIFGKTVAATNTNDNRYLTGGNSIGGLYNNFSASAVKNIFEKTQVGDVVQMIWHDSNIPHTFIVINHNDSGVYTLESNNPSGTIQNKTHSYQNLADAYAKSSRGGFTVYRYIYKIDNPDNPTPPESPSGDSLYIKTEKLPDGKAGERYEKTKIEYDIKNGGQADGFEITSGSRPDGLDITVANGEVHIEGTPSRADTFYFALRLKNDKGYSNTRNYVIKIESNGGSEPAINITTNQLKDGKAGEHYKDRIFYDVRRGGQAKKVDYKGSLPDGLALNVSESDGQVHIEGDPTRGGEFSFTIIISNNEGEGRKDFTVKIAEDPQITTDSNLGEVTNGTDFHKTLECKGGSAYWTHIGGEIPKDINLNQNAGTLDGTVKVNIAAKTAYSFKLKAENNLGSAEKTFYLTVKPEDPVENLNINGTFKNGVIKKSYSSSLTVSGGTAPYTWKKSSGTIPDGLKLSPNSTGTKLTVKGTPTTAKEYTFKLKVTDKNGAAVSKTFTIKITKPAIKGTLTASGVVKKSYSSSLTVSGGTAPYTWKKSSGTIPDGLKLSPNSTGTKLTVKGTPTTAKEYTFKLKVTDKNGAAVSKTFTIKITKPAIKGTLTASGVVKKSYSSSLTVSGGTAPYTWKKSSGTIPDGLKLSPNSTGTKLTVKGTPTTAKEYTFKLKVTDKNGAAVSKSCTIKINTASKLKLSGSFPGGFSGYTYNGSITVSGGTVPYTWKKSGGTIPAGLKLTTTKTGTKAKLSGTPSKAGNYSFKLTVTDSKGLKISKNYKVIIEEDEVITIEGSKKDFAVKNTAVYVPVRTGELKILSGDILLKREGRDEDFMDVKANKPVKFIIEEHSKLESPAYDVQIYVNGQPVEGIIVSDDFTFTLPAEFIKDDFKVQAGTNNFETNELFLSAVE